MNDLLTATVARPAARRPLVAMSPRSLATGACLVAGVLATATGAMAQDHEPFHVTQQNRGLFVEIEDAYWGIEPFHSTMDGIGTWIDSGSVSTADVSGEAMQWTRLDDRYLGGYLACEIANASGVRRDAGAVSHATFEVRRTGRLRAFVEFGGSFASEMGEASAVFTVSRLHDDGTVQESIIDWSNHGTWNDDANHTADTEMLLSPGTYHIWQQVSASVLGTEIGPDLGFMEMFGAIELDRLPDCGDPAAGVCTESKATPSCDDAVCCARICEMDPYCCDNRWDAICVAEAQESCVTGCTGDLNHDGTVNGADQGLLFAAWGTHPPTYIHPADLNMDGAVNGTDLGILFAAWGDC